MQFLTVTPEENLAPRLCLQLMDGCVTAACAAALMPQHCRPCAPSRSTKWPTRIVAVVAAYDRPRQQFQNSSTVTFIIYQRLRPSEPNYSPNIGAEGGVHIQFILDHYGTFRPRPSS